MSYSDLLLVPVLIVLLAIMITPLKDDDHD